MTVEKQIKDLIKKTIQPLTQEILIWRFQQCTRMFNGQKHLKGGMYVDTLK
jgi:hypothetical protein